MEKVDELKGTYSRIFEGTMVNVTKCTNVDFISTKDDIFGNIPLSISEGGEGSHITQALKEYTKPELLKGTDMYDTGSAFGKQPAEKYIQFKKLPPVLQLHLKRYGFNSRQYNNIKVNDLFDFDEIMDLDDVLDWSDDKEPNVRNIYHLHGIVIHSGTANSGHYYTYIRNQADKDIWLCFDDHSVNVVNKDYAFAQSKGGKLFDFRVQENVVKKRLKSDTSNAYMLVYIRGDQREAILEPPSTTECPRNLIDKFSEEQKKFDLIEKRRNWFNNSEIYLISDQTIQGWDSFGVFPSTEKVHAENGLLSNSVYRRQVFISKKLTFNQLRKLLLSKSQLSENYTLKFFKVTFPKKSTWNDKPEFKLEYVKNYNDEILYGISRKNIKKSLLYVKVVAIDNFCSFEPANLFWKLGDNEYQTIKTKEEELQNFKSMYNEQGPDWEQNLYVLDPNDCNEDTLNFDEVDEEEIPDDSKPNSDFHEDHIILFVKYYDPVATKFVTVGDLLIKKDTSYEDLASAIVKKHSLSIEVITKCIRQKKKNEENKEEQDDTMGQFENSHSELSGYITSTITKENLAIFQETGSVIENYGFEIDPINEENVSSCITNSNILIYSSDKNDLNSISELYFKLRTTIYVDLIEIEPEFTESDQRGTNLRDNLIWEKLQITKSKELSKNR